MNKRLLVQIPPGQLAKLDEIKRIRKDLSEHPYSKVIHTLLQERIARILNENSNLADEGDSPWVEYIRERTPLHTVGPLVLGALRNSPYHFTKGLNYCDREKFIWAVKRDEVLSVGNLILNNHKDSKWSKNHFFEYKESYLKLKNYILEISKIELNKIDLEEVSRIYLEVYEYIKEFSGLSSLDIDSIDYVLEMGIKSKLEEFMNKKKNDLGKLNSYYNILTTPKEISYVSKERLKLYRLIEEIQNDLGLSKLFELDTQLILEKVDSKFIEKIQMLVENYWWTSLSWNSDNEKSIKDYIDEIKSVIHNNEIAKEKIAQEYLNQEEVKIKKLQISKELGFDEEFLQYLEVFENYAIIHDYRKEIQMKFTQMMRKLVAEIARRSEVRYDDLMWCWPPEVQEVILTKKLPKELIDKRKDAILTIITENNVEEYVGMDAKKKKTEELNSSTSKITNFQGAIASVGKVAGMAKICYSHQDALKKIKEGDILVTGMTTPDFAHAMKKAGAIVTDEGGVTCHAAIISRELGIPCIIATDIATKTINDGDLIEVNANHGVVKIIKRNEESLEK
jgi:phosphohistidine swiveling domain-containing protein